MRWAWHVACIGEKMNAYRILVGKTKKTQTNKKKIDVCGRIILSWILER
jgi:hypothetical protein